MAKKAKTLYRVEITDTFGGHANFSWVQTYFVESGSLLGAIRHVGILKGIKGWRKTWDTGDSARYDVKGAPICAFVNEDDSAERDDVDRLRRLVRGLTC